VARIDVAQDVVLERLVERLRSALGLPEQRCYETLSPDSPPVIPPGGEYFLTVSPGPGRFVEGEQVAGNITEVWSVVVSIFSRVRLDESGRDQETLRKAGRGLLAVKQKVLTALCGHDLQTRGNDTFLRWLLYAESCTEPRVLERQAELGPLRLANMELEFGVHFDWDIT
jgi:hypothetical protein